MIFKKYVLNQVGYKAMINILTIAFDAKIVCILTLQRELITTNTKRGMLWKPAKF